MLNIFVATPQGLSRVDPGSPPTIPDHAVWIDLLEPTVEEEKFTPGQEIDLGMQTLQSDGSWQVQFKAPAKTGNLNFWPICSSRDGDKMVVEQEYAPLMFTVQNPGGPDIPAPADPAPVRDMPDSMPMPDVPGLDATPMPVATPMPGQPTFTG